MQNLGGQISGLPQLLDVFFRDGGRHPSALKDRSGHDRRFGAPDLNFGCLSLRWGKDSIEHGREKIKALSLYKEGEYQESSP